MWLVVLVGALMLLLVAGYVWTLVNGFRKYRNGGTLALFTTVTYWSGPIGWIAFFTFYERIAKPRASPHD